MEIFRFAARVPSTGLTLVEVKEPAIPEQSPGWYLSHAWEAPLRTVHVVENGHNSGLFRNFAKLNTDAESIKRFAEQFGFLSSPLPLANGVGEPIALWRSEIHTIRLLLEAWDKVRVRDKSYLQGKLHWRSDGVRVTLESKDGAHISYTLDYSPDRVNAMRKAGEVSGPMWEFLRAEVNKRLEKEGPHPRLIWSNNSACHPELRLAIRSSSLLGAIYLQFARALEGDHPYLQCRECRTWFEDGAERKAGADFCSEACKQRDKRKRKKAAKEMRSRGVPLRQIAKKLRSDVTTVKGWVK